MATEHERERLRELRGRVRPIYDGIEHTTASAKAQQVNAWAHATIEDLFAERDKMRNDLMEAADITERINTHQLALFGPDGGLAQLKRVLKDY